MAKKDRKEPKRTGETLMVEVVVEVGDDHIAEKDKLNTELTKEILKAEAEKSEYARQKNAELKALRKSQVDNLNTIETGRETIEVECRHEIDEQRLEMLTKRVDTGETLHAFTRALTAEERQTRFGDPPAEEPEQPEEPSDEDTTPNEAA